MPAICSTVNYGFFDVLLEAPDYRNQDWRVAGRYGTLNNFFLI